MRYGRASEILCRGPNISLNLVEYRGPQRMPMVCREAWTIVEVVKPSWAAWKTCKFFENVAY